jgi:hypothetical protein
MQVYPVLEPGSLSQRCNKDIQQFISEQGITATPNAPVLLTELTDSSTKEEIKAKIDELTPKFEQGDAVMYVDTISQVSDPTKQQELWIARTYLVYQLLIVLTLSLQNAGLYNIIFTPKEKDSGIAGLTFRADVTTAVLANIKLGIFGSLTPTSDIDIGFQYSGPSDKYTPCLAYIVSRFEMLFLIFTGKRCLDFDVESYADMITVPNTDENTRGELPDLFYLDTGRLTWDVPTQRSLLPIAFNSIVRNVMIGLGVDQQFDLNGVISQIELESNLPPDLISLKTDAAAIADFEASKATISAFLEKSYNEQIQAYYDAVNKAEVLKVSTLEGKTTIDQLQGLSDEEIIRLIVAIGQALTLRMESYTFSGTVIHIVRMLQAEAQRIAPAAVSAFTQASKAYEARNAVIEPTIEEASAKSSPSAAASALQRTATKLAPPGKYETTAPGDVCKLGQKLTTPKCVVGKTGFILSALEQIGYMYRFHETYCQGGIHPDPTKCDKKIGKYKNRLVHAIGNLKHTQGGGKRVNRRTYMKHAFMKLPSRYNHKTKTKTKMHHFKTVKKNQTKLYKKYRNSKKMKRAYMKKTVRK